MFACGRQMSEPALPELTRSVSGIWLGGRDSCRASLVSRAKHEMLCIWSGAMRFEIDQSARARNRRVVRRRLVQTDAQKIAQRQRIRRAPSDPALRVDAFEIADQRQPEVDPRWQARAAHRLGIEWLALTFDEIIEVVLGQQLIQPRVERMAAEIGRSVVITHISGCRSRSRFPMDMCRV